MSGGELALVAALVFVLAAMVGAAVAALTGAPRPRRRRR